MVSFYRDFIKKRDEYDSRAHASVIYFLTIKIIDGSTQKINEIDKIRTPIIIGADITNMQHHLDSRIHSGHLRGIKSMIYFDVFNDFSQSVISPSGTVVHEEYVQI